MRDAIKIVRGGHGKRSATQPPGAVRMKPVIWLIVLVNASAVCGASVMCRPSRLKPFLPTSSWNQKMKKMPAKLESVVATDRQAR